MKHGVDRRAKQSFSACYCETPHLKGVVGLFLFLSLRGKHHHFNTEEAENEKVCITVVLVILTMRQINVRTSGKFPKGLAKQPARSTLLSRASEPSFNQRELLTETFSRCSGYIFLVSEETNLKEELPQEKRWLDKHSAHHNQSRAAKQPTTASNLRQCEANARCTLARWEQTANTVLKLNYD